MMDDVGLDSIAVIGMAGRFPGASNPQAFWRNLRAGIESISFFTGDELAAAGVAAATARKPGFVNAGGVLDGVELFDAGFFGISARDAEAMDPQQRIFLECAWEALEDGGYDPAAYPGPIGVFGGSRMSTYLFQVQANPEFVALVGSYQLLLGNDKDHLTTQTSYRLNLRGPSLNVETACSTSLVAVSLACQSLIDQQSDMALAGGVSILLPQKAGYFYREGGISSPDGHTRAFDSDARGMVGGNGAGVVLLKRLTDAISDGDHIYAVLRGWAVNNDGSAKASYTAPSVQGQAEVIAMAHALGNVSPETISYVEAHGTGTMIGDPIEIQALTQAFRLGTKQVGFCAIGSVKANIGHLDPAAGIASLIKTVLALDHGEIPASLHFRRPSPQIDFANSPFFVNTQLKPWYRNGAPRRAGVSAFGIGGTNAHVVLEEAPPAPPARPGRPWQLLPLSARSPAALDAMTANLRQTLIEQPELALDDVAFTCQVGRRAFAHRQVLVCRDVADAAAALEHRDPRRVLRGRAGQAPHLAWLFPGQGSQHVGMAAELYRTDGCFRAELDAWAERFEHHLQLDLRRLLYPAAGDEATCEHQLGQTAFTQPALFAVEAALARTWMAWGIRPHAMLGHSIGEYVAAHLAGVLSCDDAAALVSARGRLMQSLPEGAMLAVPLDEQTLAAQLPPDVEIAAVNAPRMCVAAGPPPAIARLATALASGGIEGRILHTSHAFHSAMMEPILADFARCCAHVRFAAPAIPWLSNVTGTWITAAEAQDASYWVTHLRRTVRFRDALQHLLDGETVLLECGAGQTLTTVARQQGVAATMLPSLPAHHAARSDTETMLTTLGRLWMAGAPVDWSALHKGAQRRRVSLPTYPFERQRYWIEPSRPASPATSASPPISDHGFYLRTWPAAVLPPVPPPVPEETVLLFNDPLGLADAVAAQLRASGRHVLTVTAGDAFRCEPGDAFTIVPGERQHLDQLVQELRRLGRSISRIAHFWTTPPTALHTSWEELGFHALLQLAQVLTDVGAQQLSVVVFTRAVHVVSNGDTAIPEKAALLGPVRVAPQESATWWRCVDVGPDESDPNGLAQRLAAELLAGTEPQVAWRGATRSVEAFAPVELGAVAGGPRPRDLGTYLVTGGLGGIGLSIAMHLARAHRARLVLTSRRSLPDRRQWPELLADNRDPACRAIEAIEAIEAAGGEVVHEPVDVTDQDAMRGVVRRAVDRFGAVHGVFHCAGIAGGGLIQLKDRVVADAVLAPKLRGMRVLEAVLPAQVDFVVLCSSLASVVGGLGQVDYCAANAALDAFAHHLRAKRIPAVAINWPAWRDVGMAVETPLALGTEAVRHDALARGLRPDDAIAALLQILDSGRPQVLIGPARPADAARAAELPAAPPPPSAAHARPELTTSFEAPASDIEQSLAAMWQALLGIAPIGRHDDFFELGGHSLLALQIVARVRDTYQIELPVRRIFEWPTPAKLGTAIEEALLLQVEAMSDAEVHHQLQD